MVNATTTEDSPPKPTLDQYDLICLEWKQKDKVAKLLGMFSSHKLYEDWCVAESDETKRASAKWPAFIKSMKDYYKPTENQTLQHFHFRTIAQQSDETFSRFCNRVEAEAKHCNFKCASETCTAGSTAVRDQVIIGTTESSIIDEALKQSWDLKLLRQEGMKMESAARSGAQIAGESHNNLNKIGKYSYSNMKSSHNQQYDNRKQSITCYNCGSKVSGSITKHKEESCSAKSHICRKCQKSGHFERVCRSKPVKQIEPENEETQGNQEEVTYNINLFRIKATKNCAKPQLKATKSDFNVQVVTNNHLDRVVAETGAHISV